MNVPTTVGWTDECYAEKAEQAQQHPGTKTKINPADETRKKQCKPKEAKPNDQRDTLVKGIIILHIAKPHAASSQHTHVTHIQGCAHMHPVIRRAAT